MTAEIPTEAVVRASADRNQVEAWTFVLEAVEIPHRMAPVEEGWAVFVPANLVGVAHKALDADEQETAEGPTREPAPPDHGASYVGIAAALTITAFFVVTGDRQINPRGWFDVGSAVAERITRGEWWRAVTALTLHADIMHAAGNGAAFIVFLSALGRWLGGGVALATTLFAGIAGNLITAYSYRTGHDSVGASTATFAALGLLGGLQFMRRYRVPSVGRFKRAFLAIAAGLGLFAMLGVGEHVDVRAHASGLGVGVALGVLLGRFLVRPVGILGQGLALVGTLATLVGSWLLAFHH